MQRKQSAVRATIGWLFGPMVWAAHFFLLYGIVSFSGIAADTASQGQIRLILAALTVMALLALVAFLVWQSRDHRRHRTEHAFSFLTSTAMALTALAFVGVVWTAAGAFIMSL